MQAVATDAPPKAAAAAPSQYELATLTTWLLKVSLEGRWFEIEACLRGMRVKWTVTTLVDAHSS